MQTHLFFCGIKHSGKSTLGRLFAKERGLEWVDLDDLVLKAIAPYSTIRLFYQQQGQAAFQKKEVEALKEFLREQQQPMVISLGGGASDNQELLDLVKQHGKLVYLVVEEPILLARILRNGVPPFLDSQNPAASFHALYARRHAIYGNICDLLVQLPDCVDIRDTADYLIHVLKSEV